MKKSLLFFLFIYAFTSKAQQSLTSGLQTSGMPNFVIGINVMDSLSVPDNVNEDVVRFITFSKNNILIDSSFIATHGLGNWYYVFNTGIFSDTTARIIAHYYNTGNLIDSSHQHNFNVYPKPDWLVNGGTYLTLL